MENLSLLQRYRISYQPPLPSLFKDLKSVVMQKKDLLKKI